MRLPLVACLVVLALAAGPGRSAAQARPAPSILPGEATLGAAARLRLPAGRVLGEAPVGRDLLEEEGRSKRSQGEILMIVGAAGIVTGLLVDEDLITIAGAAVGGYGLYLYLQATR
jgi:hypothetical protein